MVLSWVCLIRPCKEHTRSGARDQLFAVGRIPLVTRLPDHPGTATSFGDPPFGIPCWYHVPFCAPVCESEIEVSTIRIYTSRYSGRNSLDSLDCCLSSNQIGVMNRGTCSYAWPSGLRLNPIRIACVCTSGDRELQFRPRRVFFFPFSTNLFFSFYLSRHQPHLPPLICSAVVNFTMTGSGPVGVYFRPRRGLKLMKKKKNSCVGWTDGP